MKREAYTQEKTNGMNVIDYAKSWAHIINLRARIIKSVL